MARRAFSRFGKGRHRAGLNYGDCFSYALATVLGEPLLYKGDDFPHTASSGRGGRAAMALTWTSLPALRTSQERTGRRSPG